MSQYYPQQGPLYPPEQNPESDYYNEGDYEYYDEEDSGSNGSFLQSALAFFAGGCLVFLCMSFCGLLLAGLWILDPGTGLSSATPMPGSDKGLLFNDPAYPDESVVNEENLQLTLLDVNRNAALEGMPAMEDREVIIVTVELVNLAEESGNFNERDFRLVNDFEEAYQPSLGAVAGSLGRGSLPAGEGLEGRLVFVVAVGETDLRLLWEPGRTTTPRYIYLQ